jgi:hypothetical protein
MDLGAALRKLVHLSTPAFLVYYFLPSPLWEGGPTPQLALIAVLIIVLAFELARLIFGIKVIGMRPYEKEQISAAAWAGIALTIAFLFFPIELAAPVIFGMALVDPVISKIRKTKWYPTAPYLLHLAIMIAITILLTNLQIWTVLALAITSAVALVAEGVKTRYVDDDFLMIVVPLIVLALLMSV